MRAKEVDKNGQKFKSIGQSGPVQPKLLKYMYLNHEKDDHALRSRKK